MTTSDTGGPPPLPAQVRNANEPQPVPVATSRAVAPDVWDTVLTGKNLFRVGLALVLLGLVFMFRYAVEAGWITEGARLALGVAASVSMLAVGARLIPVRKAYGALLAGGGIGGLYITAFAAFELYEKTSVPVAFVQLVAVSVLGVGLALWWDSEPLAIAGLVGALAAPLLLPGRMLGATGDSLYLGAVLAAAVAIFFARNWIVLYASTFAMAISVIMFDSLRHALNALGAPGQVELDVSLALIAAAFGVAPVAAWLLNKLDGPYTAYAAAAVGPVVFGLAAITRDQQSLAIIAFALAGLHLVAAVGKSDDQIYSMSHGLAGAALAIAGSVMLFDGPVALVAVAAVSLTVLVVGLSSDLDAVTWAGGLVAASAGALNLGTLAELGGVGDSVARVGTVALFGAATVAADRIGTADSLVARNLSAGYVYLATFVIGFVDLATYSQVLVTTVWSVMAVSLIVIGRLNDRQSISRLGIGTMAAVIVKVFAIDLASVETIWKVALFTVLGLVLLVVGYWISNDE